jgi:HCOMODA/2-hydroxy-3-carboxy-muconic semialdehyde decarboxylase
MKQADGGAIAEEQLGHDVVQASRILANEGVLDGFGHVSARLPGRPDCFLLSRARAPELVEPGDLLTFDADSEPVARTGLRVFAERVIHGEIYRVRPDVMAVCHHHAPAMLPFCVSDVPLPAVFHLGATQGTRVPAWDSQDEFGDANLLVSTRAQGASLARALGGDWTILMRRHGVTVVGRSVREVVFRSIYGARNAEVLAKAMSLGAVRPLSPGECEAAAAFNLSPIAVDRAWEQWCRRAGAPSPR